VEELAAPSWRFFVALAAEVALVAPIRRVLEEAVVVVTFVSEVTGLHDAAVVSLRSFVFRVFGFLLAFFTKSDKTPSLS
jgi:hypothetical protein